MARTLLVLRHGKSSWKDIGAADHDRRLTGRGRRNAQRMGRLLREADLTPDRIVSSTAVRARDTAALAAEASGCSQPVTHSPHLYHASPAAIIDVLRETGGDASKLLVVGHNPGLEHLLRLLTGCSEFMSTAALAEIQMEVESWSALTADARGRLVNLWRPRELPGDA